MKKCVRTFDWHLYVMDSNFSEHNEAFQSASSLGREIKSVQLMSGVWALTLSFPIRKHQAPHSRKWGAAITTPPKRTSILQVDAGVEVGLYAI